MVLSFPNHPSAVPPTISDQLNQLIAITTATLQSQANFKNQLAVLLKNTQNLNSKIDTLTKSTGTLANHITNLSGQISSGSSHSSGIKTPPFPPTLLPTLSHQKKPSSTAIQPTQTPTLRPKPKPTLATAPLVAITISRPQPARKILATVTSATIKGPRNLADGVTGGTILRLSGYQQRPSIWSYNTTLGGASCSAKRREWRPPWSFNSATPNTMKNENFMKLKNGGRHQWRLAWQPVMTAPNTMKRVELRPPWRPVETAPNAAGRLEWRPPWPTRSVLEDKNVLRRAGMIRVINSQYPRTQY